MDVIRENYQFIAMGFAHTILLFVIAGIGSLLLGTLLAALRVGPVAVMRSVAGLYVTLVRNTPLLLILLFFSIAGPKIGIRFTWVDIVIHTGWGDIRMTNAFAGAVVGLTLYTAAFVCEALRSGVNAVSPGQAEAARALGLTFGQSLSAVVLPQAFRTVIPPLGNVFIAMVKNSSIAAGFAVSELSSLLPRLVNADAAQLTAVLFGVVVAYMLITVPLAFGVNRLERRVAILR